MELLGDDGDGYELACKLEIYGVWRSWLGESSYIHFSPSMASPSSWSAFMRVDDGKTRAQIELQLRVRALLFDKASISLYSRPTNSDSSSTPSQFSVSKLSQSYLQLHGDDVYFTFENSSRDLFQKLDGSVSSNTTLSSSLKRSRIDDLPDSWYAQFIEKYSVSKPYKLSFWDNPRSPAEMSAYLRQTENHKRRRQAFMEDEHVPSTIITITSDNLLFPETMFPWNSVPDTALHREEEEEEEEEIMRTKRRTHTVLDTLPRHVTPNPITIERLGIKPETVETELCGHVRERNVTRLGEEKASQMSRKVVGRVLIDTGFESSKAIPVDVLSQLLSRHICKLGSILKRLTDSYRKKHSATELLRIFLRSPENNDLAAALAETLNENNKHPSSVSQNNDPGQTPPQQSPLQRWERRCHQQSSGTQVKLESPQGEDVSSFATSMMNMNQYPNYQQFNNHQHHHNSDHHDQQQQQQLSSLSGFHQPGNQFRNHSPALHSSSQTMNVSVRTLPVKVGAFQELMGLETVKVEMDDKGFTPPLPR